MEREARNAYMRAYYKKNREKILADMRTRWPDRREKFLPGMREGSRARRAADPQAKRDESEAWRLANPDYNRRYRLKGYGLSPADYAAMLAKQGGGCAICKAPPESDKRYGVLHVDHDHDTGIVRGLLCRQCNLALGVLGDNVASLTRVVDYLKGIL